MLKGDRNREPKAIRGRFYAFPEKEKKKDKDMIAPHYLKGKGGKRGKSCLCPLSGKGLSSNSIKSVNLTHREKGNGTDIA